DDLREELQIPDSFVNADTPTMLMSAETLHKIESLRIESKADLDRQETMLNQLKSLNPQQLVQAMPTAVQDPNLNSLLEQLNIAEQGLVIKKKEFGPEHSEIIKTISQIEDLKEKIKNRVDGILFSLDAKVAALRKSLEDL